MGAFKSKTTLKRFQSSNFLFLHLDFANTVFRADICRLPRVEPYFHGPQISAHWKKLNRDTNEKCIVEQINFSIIISISRLKCEFFL